MHEMSLCLSVIETLENTARENNYSAITKVWLEIGAFAAVEIKALQFSFEVATRGTIAQNAQLEIIEIEGKAWCLNCNKTITIKQRFDPCPICTGRQLSLSAGQELKIKQILVKE